MIATMTQSVTDVAAIAVLINVAIDGGNAAEGREVCVKYDHEARTLTVSDNGPGIAADALAAHFGVGISRDLAKVRTEVMRDA